MLSGLRGLAQSFVRGAVTLGRAVEETFTSLVDLGLGYVKEQFTVDWNIYDQQKALLELASERPKNELISGVLHGESQLNLTAKFKYDVKAVYEDTEGNTLTKHWSVISNTRMTQDEIAAYGAAFAEDYAPDAFPFHSEPELEGIWVRADAF